MNETLGSTNSVASEETSKVSCSNLEARGYRRFTPKYTDKYNDFFYQKKFSDQKGIKYFLEFVHYPEFELIPQQWMLKLTNNEPHMTFEIHKPISIDDAERRAELFFRTQECEYYELNYGEC